MAKSTLRKSVSTLFLLGFAGASAIAATAAQLEYRRFAGDIDWGHMRDDTVLVTAKQAGQKAEGLQGKPGAARQASQSEKSSRSTTADFTPDFPISAP